MRNILITILLSSSISLSAEDTIPTLNIVQIEVMGFDELTLSSFQEEAVQLNFSNEFKNFRLQKENGRWILLPTGIIVLTGGVIIDVYTLVFFSINFHPGESWGIVAIGLPIGTGLAVLGAYMMNWSRTGESKKTKEKNSIKTFEGY